MWPRSSSISSFISFLVSSSFSSALSALCFASASATCEASMVWLLVLRAFVLHNALARRVVRFRLQPFSLPPVSLQRTCRRAFPYKSTHTRLAKCICQNRTSARRLAAASSCELSLLRSACTSAWRNLFSSSSELGAAGCAFAFHSWTSSSSLNND